MKNRFEKIAAVIALLSAAASAVESAAESAAASAAAASAAESAAAESARKSAAAAAVDIRAAAHHAASAAESAAAASAAESAASAAAKDASGEYTTLENAALTVWRNFGAEDDAPQVIERAAADDEKVLALLDRIETALDCALDSAENAEESAAAADATAFSAAFATMSAAASAAAAASDYAASMVSYAEKVENDRLATSYARQQSAAAFARAEQACITADEMDDSYYHTVKKHDKYMIHHETRYAVIESLKKLTINAAEGAESAAHTCTIYAENAEERAAEIAAASKTRAAEIAAEIASAESAAAEIASAAESAAASAWGDFLTRAADTERAEIAKKLYAQYLAHTKAKKHISIFCYDGIVYAVTTKAPIVTTCKKSSREGDGFSLRFIPSKVLKKALAPYAETLCTESEFESIFAAAEGKNRGDVAEILYKKKHGFSPEKDSSAFWVSCDIPELMVSIKFENASICNEKTIAAAESAADT